MPYIDDLVFTHDWTHDDAETGFVTYEPNEERVRADIQMLHDEAKAKINEMIEKILADGSGDIDTTLAKQLPFSYAGDAEHEIDPMEAADIYNAIVEAYVKAFLASQAVVEDGSITYAKLATAVKAMLDNGQVVVEDEDPPETTETYTAGQMWYDTTTHSLYILESVLGESPYTATWQKVFPPPALDSDDVATTDGTGSVNEKLDLPEGSTVSDALIKLASLGSGEVLKTVWERFQQIEHYTSGGWQISQEIINTHTYVDVTYTLHYSSMIRRDATTGKTVLDTTSSGAVSGTYNGSIRTSDTGIWKTDSAFEAGVPDGYYYTLNSGDVVYLKGESDTVQAQRYSYRQWFEPGTYDHSIYLRSETAQSVTLSLDSVGTISSDNSSAYPDDGWQDGVYYIKKTAEQSAHTAKMAMFQYTGTGIFGPANPTSVSFDFVPAVIFLFSAGTTRLSDSMWTAGMVNNVYTPGRGPNADCSGGIQNDGVTLLWYADSAAAQRNTEGTTYYGIALG